MRLLASSQHIFRTKVWCVGILIGLFSLNISNNAHAEPQIAIAAYQLLGAKKQLPKILNSIRDAYTQQTGEEALPLSTINMNLSEYGLKKLGACAQKTPCFVQVSKENLPRGLPHALYIGVGLIGQKILIRFLLLDLKKGSVIAQKNKSFKGMAGLKKELPTIITSFFPSRAKLKVSGNPIGAKIHINQRLRGTIPTKTMPVPSNKTLTIRITAPKYQPWLKKLVLKTGENKHIQAKLTPIAQKRKNPVIVRSKTNKKPPPSNIPAPAFYKQWWFWTAAGVVVAGGVAVGVGLAASNPNRITGEFPFR